MRKMSWSSHTLYEITPGVVVPTEGFYLHWLSSWSAQGREGSGAEVLLLCKPNLGSNSGRQPGMQPSGTFPCSLALSENSFSPDCPLDVVVMGWGWAGGGWWSGEVLGVAYCGWIPSFVLPASCL